MGCDVYQCNHLYSFVIFLLTHPVWDVTKCIINCCNLIIFLLTHPVWDVTLTSVAGLPECKISTHTSRVGCDICDCFARYDLSNFYSHIPCGMWPEYDFVVLKAQLISTHTSRVGCDWLYALGLINHHENFYSHIPCGMWPSVGKTTPVNNISTHTSRVGCDGTIG